MSQKPKQIPYKDSYLSLANYKEPLKPVDGGFGFYGTLLHTVDGKKVQCHIDGELVENLGSYVFKKYGMKAQEYKDKFKLSVNTSLASEGYRKKMANHMRKRIEGMTDAERREWREKQKANLLKGHGKTKRTRPRLSLELRNKQGICPDQLLEKIRECANDLGYTPTSHKFAVWNESHRYVGTIDYVFGSWDKAVKKAGLAPVTYLNIFKKISPFTGRSNRHGYSREELIEYLQIYYQEHGELPTSSACQRGLIPSYSAYIRVFGSFPKAREAAGLTSP
jgi:hypothetical protein